MKAQHRLFMRSCGFCCHSLNTQGVNQHVQLCADNCIPRGERTACVTVFQDPCHNGSHTQSLENSSPFLEDSMLLKHYAQSLSWLKWSTHPHKLCSAYQHFNVALVFLLWSVFCDTAQAWVFVLVCIVTRPQPWCSYWCQCVVTAQA